jgi:hypothetical protein
MSTNAIDSLTNEEKLIVIGGLSLLGLVALGVFFLILCDPLLFRIEDDDDDFDPELYKAPPWILQQVPIQDTQPVAKAAPQNQHQQQTPPQQLVARKEASNYQYSQGRSVESFVKAQQLTAPTSPPPPPRLKNQSSQTLPITHEIQTQTELVPSQHSKLSVRQPQTIQSQNQPSRPQYLPISAGSESSWNDAQRQRAQQSRVPTSSSNATALPVYNAPGGALEPLPETAPPKGNNSSKIVNDDSSSRDETREEDTFHDEEETSTVEIFSFTPGQSLVSLPDEVKNFDKGGGVSPITPAQFRPPPHKGSPGGSPHAKPKTLPSSSSSMKSKVSMNSIRTLIPRYSHKAERHRFIILNGLLVVIAASIGTAIIVELYT